MVSQEIKGENYVVQYDADATTIRFQGELALGGPKEYAPINHLIDAATQENPEMITIDLRELAFLNSSGISMLSKFVLGLRKKRRFN